MLALLVGGQEVELIFLQNNMSFLAGSRVYSCRGTMGRSGRTELPELNRQGDFEQSRKQTCRYEGSLDMERTSQYLTQKALEAFCTGSKRKRKKAQEERFKKRTGLIGLSWALGGCVCNLF